jgi:DNA-binding CsgD family transcriptional regulator
LMGRQHLLYQSIFNQPFVSVFELELSMSAKLHGVLCDRLRLEELAALRLLDTPPEEPFDRLTRMAARALGAPIALVSLVDERRQFFKSSCGLPEPLASVRETPLTHSFCQHVVANAAPLIIANARVHPLVRENGAVSDFGVIAYLGMPLAMPKGLTFGSFCVVDTEPRQWTIDDQQIMTALAASVISEIALRSAYKRISQLQGQLTEQKTTLHAAQRIAHLSRLLLCKDELGPSEPWPDAAQSSFEKMSDAVNHALSEAKAGAGTEPSVNDDLSLDVLRERLTARQLEVFDLLMRGLQTKEIARHLGLSPRTIEVHRAKILERLQVSSFSALLKQLLARPDSH